MNSYLKRCWRGAGLLLGTMMAVFWSLPAPAADTLNNAPSLSAQGLVTVAGMEPAARPRDVPGDYVLTPRGYYSPSCVISLGADEAIHGEGTIVRADGTQRTFPPCTQPTYTASGQILHPGDSSRSGTNQTIDSVSTPEVVTDISGNGNFLTQYAGDLRVGRLTVSFTIPKNPPWWTTVFYWPSFNGGTLQPVIGWENGKWSLRSWYCCTSGHYVNSNWVAAHTGDRGVAEMYSTCAPGVSPCNRWVIKTSNLTTGESSTLIWPYSFWVGGGSVAAIWVEAYGRDCNIYPADGSWIFHDVAIYDVNLRRIASPKWTDIQRGFGCPAVTLKSTPTSVKLSY